MLGRSASLDAARAEMEAESIRKMLKFERDLQEQVQTLMEQYRETRKELRRTPDIFYQMVKDGLALAGQPAQTKDNTPPDMNNRPFMSTP